MLNFFGKRLRYMQEVSREERGFTLIELLVVVAIIGILAAIAIPFFLGQRAKAADARSKANVREAASAIQVYYTEEGAVPPNIPGSLSNSGFRGSDPPVTGWAAGSASVPNWCVASVTNGGTVASWKMEDEDGLPVAGTCPAAP